MSHEKIAKELLSIARDLQGGSEDFDRRVAGSIGHHHQEGGKWYADTAFINAVSRVYPGSSLEHMGFGEFYLNTPDGKLEFDRGRGKDFEGKSGRSHQLYDDAGGKVVKKAIQLMERAGKSVEASSRTAGKILKVGDYVMFRMRPGEPAVKARVTDLSLVDAPKSKNDVADLRKAAWSLVKDNWVLVVMDNKKFAYGYQVEPA